MHCGDFVAAVVDVYPCCLDWSLTMLWPMLDDAADDLADVMKVEVRADASGTDDDGDGNGYVDVNDEAVQTLWLAPVVEVSKFASLLD